MKLAAAFAALPAFLADDGSDVNNFCLQETTDALACQNTLNSESSVEAVRFCLEKESMEERLQCMQAILNDEDEEGFATGEFAMGEFLDGIGEDPMLQNVLAELNGLQAYLEANGVTRSISADGDEIPIDNEQLASASDSMDGLKRFVELKQLVSWMQPKDKRISRYCFYGCWCLPEGAHSFVSGEGRPVDLVDKACQYLWFCYTCAKEEFSIQITGTTKFKECVPDKQKYTFRFKYNKQKPADYSQRDIVCKDNFYSPINTVMKWKSSCAKAICECDRGLAMRLYRAWRHWDKSRHRIWSQKVTTCTQLSACQQLTPGSPAQQACIKRGCLFIVARRCLDCTGAGCGGNANNQNQVCCGLYEEDGGRMQMRDHGATHACCAHDARGAGNYAWNGNWYNQITHQCVAGVVSPVASG